METEVWKDVKGYEGIYQVSNKGSIKSIGRWVNHNTKKGVAYKKEIIMKPGISGSSGRKYYEVCFRKNGEVKYLLVHRLVALHFIDNPLNKPQVNHKDCNKLNNHADNLEWSTRSENIQHSYDMLGSDHGSSKLVLNTETGIFYDSIKEAANAHELKYGTLTENLRGRSKNNTSFITL